MDWIIAALLSAVFISAYNIIRKKTLAKEHALEYLAVYSFFCFLLVLPFMPKINFALPLSIWILILFKSIITSTGFYMMTKAIRHIELSSVAPLALLTPLFLVFISYFYLNEPLTQNHFFGIILIVLGAYVLEMDHHKAGKSIKDKLKHLASPFMVFKHNYYHYVLFGTILFAFSVTFDKIILDPKVINLSLPAVSPLTFLFLFRLFTTIIFFSLLSFEYDGLHGVAHGIKNAGGLIFFAALAFNLGDFFYYNALTIGLAALVLPIKRLSTLFTTFIGGEILHEKNILPKSVASVIMIAGVVVLSL